MPSFDVVCEVDKQEIDNAVNQAKKEIIQRFDFKNSKTQIELDKSVIKILSDDDFKMKQVLDVLKGKIVKRGIDLKSVETGKTEPGPASLVKCEVKIIEGIDQDHGKKITALIKESKLKVQAQIQDNQVRITGKKKDDLQEAMGLLRGKDVGIPLQFKNFRD